MDFARLKFFFNFYQKFKIQTYMSVHL